MVAVAGHSMLLLALVALMGAGVVLMVDGRTVLVRVAEPEGLFVGGGAVVRGKRAGFNKLLFNGARRTSAVVDGEETPFTNYQYVQTRPDTIREVIRLDVGPLLGKA